MEALALEFLRRIYEPEPGCLETVLGRRVPCQPWPEAVSGPPEQHESDQGKRPERRRIFHPLCCVAIENFNDLRPSLGPLRNYDQGSANCLPSSCLLF